MLNLLLGAFVSLLPSQLRSRFEVASTADLHRATMISGFLEAALGLLLFAGRYIYFIQYRVGTIADAAIKAKGGEDALGSNAVQFGMGYVSLVEYIFSPLSLLVSFMAIEGALRLLAAAFAGESPPILPLYLAGCGYERIQAARAEHALGPRVADEVHHVRGTTYDLGIATCRPKTEWDQLATIEYEDKFYELHEKKRGARPRPFIYLLREIPRGKVIRGLHHYNPNDVLVKKK